MLLLFLRHGSPDYPLDRYPDPFNMGLSGVGRREARAARAGVSAFAPDVVFSSDFMRAMETARIAAGPATCAPRLLPALRERTFLSLAGSQMKDVEQILGPAAFRAVMTGNSDHVELPGEETYEHARARLVTGLKSVYRDHRSARVLVVAHGGPHAWLIEHALGISLKGHRNLRLDPGHFSLFSFTAGAISLERINCTGECIRTWAPATRAG